MIISKTPLRLSFFSGGSDLPSFYEHEDGAAFSVTIDKFIYVCVHKTPHCGIKFMYEDVQHVYDIDDMQHHITKETLKVFDNLGNNLTIASISDILCKGSGLGSSSAFTVGLWNALYTLDGGELNNPTRSAIYAATIEMDKCNYPVGLQDQYAAAYGGLNLFRFSKGGKVKVDKPKIAKKILNKLEDNLLLVYSGKERQANVILQKQKEAMLNKEKFALVAKNRNKAFESIKILRAGNTDDFGNLLHEAWIDKKQIVSGISDTYFDTIYNTATKAGAIGGKLLGAGGGGFFLFYVPKDKRSNVINKLTSDTLCKIYDFKFYDKGSHIITKD